MARSWLSFWNQDTRRAQRGGAVPHSSDANIWVPYGSGHIAVADTVYCVAIEQGELLLFGKLTVGRLDVDLDHVESVDVWAKSGSDTWVHPPTSVRTPTVDRLRYVKSTGVEDGFKRTRAAGVSGHPFQGRASLRELIAGGDELDRLL